MFKKSQLRQVYTEGSTGGSHAASFEVPLTSAGTPSHLYLRYCPDFIIAVRWRDEYGLHFSDNSDCADARDSK